MFGRRLRFIKFLALIIAFSITVIIHQRITLGATDSTTTTVSVTATSIFFMGFYTDEKVIYSTAVPFSNVDPTQTFVYPNGRAENDGKSDTGIVCITNTGEPWYLKIQGAYSEGLPEDSVKYYYSKPWNRNNGYQTNGTLAYNEEWRPIPKEPATIYTSGSDDTVNTSFGTLSTFSFAVDPRGLSADKTYTISVTYTMTSAP